jgi:hypothetical protein
MPVPKLERVNTSTGEPFYFLEIYRKQCGENFENAAKLLGAAAQNVIMCEGVTLPPDCMLKEYNSVKFRELLLMNSAVELLNERKFRRESLRICLVDLKGEYASYVETLTQKASLVTVCTQNESFYEPVLRGIYEKTGASVPLSEKMPILNDYDIIISPCFLHNKLLSNCAIFYSPAQKNYEIFRGSRLSVPKKLSQLIPEGVSSLDFAGALYGHCHIKEFGLCRYADFMCVNNIK